MGRETGMLAWLLRPAENDNSAATVRKRKEIAPFLTVVALLKAL